MRITVARSPEEVEALRGSWEMLRSVVPATEPGLFLELAAAEPGAIRPHVILLERGGTPHAALVAKLRQMPLQSRLGSISLYTPTARVLVVVDGGAIGRIDEATAETLVRELLDPLDRREADVCIIRHLPIASPLRAAVRSQVPFARRGLGRRAEARWSRALPGSYEEFLGTLSRKTRKGMRHPLHRLESEFGERLSRRAFRDPSELTTFLRNAEAVSQRTYQRHLRVGFSNDEPTRRLAAYAAERGWFRGWALYLDERPIAFDMGIVYRGTFHWTSGAFDPAFAEHRPGASLTAIVIEEICADPEVSALDFGLGDAEYKRRLGCSARFESDVLVYASRVRPLRINLVTSTLTLVTRPLVRLRAWRR